MEVCTNSFTHFLFSNLHALAEHLGSYSAPYRLELCALQAKLNVKTLPVERLCNPTCSYGPAHCQWLQELVICNLHFKRSTRRDWVCLMQAGESKLACSSCWSLCSRLCIMLRLQCNSRREGSHHCWHAKGCWRRYYCGKSLTPSLPLQLTAVTLDIFLSSQNSLMCQTRHLHIQHVCGLSKGKISFPINHKPQPLCLHLVVATLQPMNGAAFRSFSFNFFCFDQLLSKRRITVYLNLRMTKTCCRSAMRR